MTEPRPRTWPPPADRYTILKTDPDDQPPEHDPAKPWAIIHPTGIAGATRRITRRPTQADALTFVLATPEVRRRTARRK